MMEFISLYGLFLAKIVTFIVLFSMLILLVFNLKGRREARRGELKLVNLNEQYKEAKRQMQLARMSETEQKNCHKEFKKQQKEKHKLEKKQSKSEKSDTQKKFMYLIDFKGSIDAHEVASLREEISAILAVATREDEVLLRLESAGGLVHGYGLAASQLQRLRNAGIRLTVAVDKVAASGGYMMACVADSIISAPFAVLGSIGVVAQIPNFHRLLKKNNIDIELHTAGEFKRTLTLFGENTEKGREKFCHDLNEAHLLFKHFVQQQRPTLDIDKIATGEHWFGLQAKEKGLVDAIGTSDDFLICAMEKYEITAVSYFCRKRLIERVTSGVAENVTRQLLQWWQSDSRMLR